MAGFCVGSAILPEMRLGWRYAVAAWVARIIQNSACHACSVALRYTHGKDAQPIPSGTNSGELRNWPHGEGSRRAPGSHPNRPVPRPEWSCGDLGRDGAADWEDLQHGPADVAQPPDAARSLGSEPKEDQGEADCQGRGFVTANWVVIQRNYRRTRAAGLHPDESGVPAGRAFVFAVGSFAVAASVGS